MTRSTALLAVRRTAQVVVAVCVVAVTLAAGVTAALAGQGSWSGSYSGGGRCAAHAETMTFEVPDQLPSSPADITVSFSYDTDACPDANPSPSFTYEVFLYDARAVPGGAITGFGCTNSSVCTSTPAPANAAFHGPVSERSGSFTAAWSGPPPPDGTYWVLVDVSGDILTLRDRGPVDTVTPARLVIGEPTDGGPVATATPDVAAATTGSATAPLQPAASDPTASDTVAPPTAATSTAAAQDVSAESSDRHGFPVLSFVAGCIVGAALVLALRRSGHGYSIHLQALLAALVGAVIGLALGGWLGALLALIAALGAAYLVSQVGARAA